MRHAVTNQWASLATIAALAMFRTGLEHDSPLAVHQQLWRPK